MLTSSCDYSSTCEFGTPEQGVAAAIWGVAGEKGGMMIKRLSVVCFVVVTVGCATENSGQKFSAETYERSASHAIDRHVECIVKEAEKRAHYQASASDIADAVVSVCDDRLAWYKAEMLNYIRAKYRSPNAVSAAISGLQTSIDNIRAKAKNSATLIVLDARAAR
jgi:hypothetical protein